ncbi:hypothetical protein [Nocardioides sp. AE5]|uniref:hypothetical protein n=1 Tax=Nocardioides sp. AE5 TaxID=2962573 RepID=UPI002882A520|nr:hypothetical protein [Nocardioides sp. AE5]MDT0202559.1 hypothetical protein [Nocardioides sp. AE5]
MIRAALALAAFILGALALPGTAAASTATSEPDPALLAEISDAWAQDPVYLSSRSGALDPDDANQISDRIDGWRNDVFIAVLPASAFDDLPGATDPQKAIGFIEALADVHGPDGIYIVAFGGVGTYGAAIGTDDPVGPIMADQVAQHTLGQLAETLNGVLDDLGAPDSPDGRSPWPYIRIGLLVAAIGVGAIFVKPALLRRRRRAHGRERWSGPAEYRPSFDVQPDEHDTVVERLALAREDVTRLGEQLDREDLPTTDPAVAAHVQAALDGYAEASRRVDGLTTDDELRELAEITDHARWQIECARARIDGTPPPARRAPCFLDPGHGISVTDWSWAPAGGVERPVPVCRACLERLSGGARLDGGEG